MLIAKLPTQRNKTLSIFSTQLETVAMDEK